MISGFASRIEKKYEGSAFDIIGSVAHDAAEMAGIGLGDIDGLCVVPSTDIFDVSYPNYLGSQVAQYLGIRPRYMEMVQFGGPSVLACLHRAYRAVKSGLSDNVLILQGGKGSSRKELPASDYQSGTSTTPYDELLQTYPGLDRATVQYAMVAKRYSKVYNATDEQRAMVAVFQRLNANANSRALFRGPLSASDVLSSRVVAEPLHLYEIVSPVDGFHAFIVSRRSGKLRSLDVLAYGEAHWPEALPDCEDITYTPVIESARRASFDLGKVDAFELYDSYTITVMLEIEDLGLADRGKATAFLEKHDLTYKGDIPINTGGGSLNVGQPAYMSGGVILEEAVLQLNNMAGGHQVSGTDVVLVNGLGGRGGRHAVTLVLGEGK